MALPLPNLDDRRWTDLVDEGRALIPRYAPGWTDHNIHDPGITLIELFAWLTEMTVYRLNRVPERHRRKFLALIGFSPWPPRAAQTVLTFDPDSGTSPFELPGGTEFEATNPDGQPIQFRTLRDLTVAVVALAAVQVEQPDAKGNLVIRNRTGDWRDGLLIAALGQHPQPGEALYLGFTDLPAEISIALSFHFQGPGNDAQERERIVREAAAQHAACRHVLPDITCEDDSNQPEPSLNMLPPHHSAHVVWEVLTGVSPNPWTSLEPVTGTARPQVGQVMDDTSSLTLDGIVEVNLPATIVPTTLGEVSDPLFYLRCRLEAGAYDTPPMLMDVAPNGVVAEQAVAVFQTFAIGANVTPVNPPAQVKLGTTARLDLEVDTEGVIQALTFQLADTPGHIDVPVLDYLAPTGGVPGRITLELVLIGVGSGRPGQEVTLPQAPVQVESFRLYTHAGGAWQEWARRDDFDASGRTDSHFVLETTSGEITCGDGESGRVFQAGALILAAYRATRAAAGNVAAGKVTRPAKTPRNALWFVGLSDTVKDQLPHIVTNRVPAIGGRAAEELSHAIGRALETQYAHERLLDLRAETKCQTLDQVDRNRVRTLPVPTRAVNLLDIERLALDVPGTRVARARVWAGVHLAYPCLQAPGVVTVVVVPDMPIAKPEPSQGLLEAVKHYLDRRCMVCTRLEVVGPQYLEVRVSARVRTRPHTNATRIRTKVLEALDAFLDPRRGGPDGLGWPFGRDIYRSEILQVIDSVPGVDHVLELSLSGETSEPRCGNLPSVPPGW